MTNAEKYRTAEERGRAFDKWCHTRGGCNRCILQDTGIELSICVCPFYWLDLEAEEEKIEDCPYCGRKTVTNIGHLFKNKLHHWVECTNPDCMYRSCHSLDKSEAIKKHNRVARAVMDAGKKEEIKE